MTKTKPRLSLRIRSIPWMLNIVFLAGFFYLLEEKWVIILAAGHSVCIFGYHKYMSRAVDPITRMILLSTQCVILAIYAVQPLRNDPLLFLFTVPVALVISIGISLARDYIRWFMQMVIDAGRKILHP